MRTRRIIAERPADIPNNWIIMNAPRPIMGHKEWTGNFISGISYAALDPNERNFEKKFNFNQSQDATILEYITQRDVVDKMLAFYQAQPKLWERLKDHDFTDPDIQKQLVETWYNLERNWINDNEET